MSYLQKKSRKPRSKKSKKSRKPRSKKYKKSKKSRKDGDILITPPKKDTILVILKNSLEQKISEFKGLNCCAWISSKNKGCEDVKKKLINEIITYVKEIENHLNKIKLTSS